MIKKLRVSIIDLPDEAAPAGFGDHPGYFGSFTRNQAPGAITNGTTIVKTRSGSADPNPDGTRGVVIGSLDVYLRHMAIRQRLFTALLCRRFTLRPDGFIYFIEWETMPRVVVTVADRQVGRSDAPCGSAP